MKKFVVFMIIAILTAGAVFATQAPAEEKTEKVFTVGGVTITVDSTELQKLVSEKINKAECFVSYVKDEVKSTVKAKLLIVKVGDEFGVNVVSNDGVIDNYYTVTLTDLGL